jgi:flagellum-specific ATP synthase
VYIFDKYAAVLDKIDPIKYTGVVTKVQGLIIESHGPQVVIGELCQILIPKGKGVVWAEVVAVRSEAVQMMPYEDMTGIEVGCVVIAMGEMLSVPVSERLLGRVLDCMGRPIDTKGNVGSRQWNSIFRDPPHVLNRQKIDRRIVTGIRTIDFLTPVGKGQRLGIFSGSGVGKSTLLGMVARNTSADVNVIALIGERGREVREFIENDLGERGLKRSVIVVSSSNSPPLSRIRGAFVATTIAEYFRELGNDVMLLFDSVTRFARAQREIGLSIGEPPANRGYTPSVFSTLPKLLERCGTSERGTITGFYTILVDADDMDEPISDAVRGILDGHIVLSRPLAEKNHYPAIDPLQSISRLGVKISGPKTKEAAGYMRRMIATYRDNEDLINVGAYARGSNAEIDEAIDKMPELNEFQIQAIDEKTSIQDTFRRAEQISGVTIPTEEIDYETV